MSDASAMRGWAGPVNGVIEGLKGLGRGRLIALGAVAAGILALLAVMAFRAGRYR